MIKFLKGFFCCFLIVSIVCAAMAKGYGRIDSHAKFAPPVSSEVELKRAVQYLMTGANTDEEKARAIYAWIIYNMEYDDYKFRIFLENEQKGRSRSVPGVDSILKTHIGVCEDIARLYVKMAEYANLEARVVYGIASQQQGTIKKSKINEYQHAWVVVKIGREWEYVEPTWALKKVFGDVTTDADYRRRVSRRVRQVSALTNKNREVPNEWFMTDKEEMIKTHFPNDEQWQLQKRRISRNQFLRQFQ